MTLVAGDDFDTSTSPSSTSVGLKVVVAEMLKRVIASSATSGCGGVFEGGRAEAAVNARSFLRLI
jgi:hypothetical protein